MISWMEQLYVGEGAQKNQKRIQEGIRQGKLLWNVYVLMLPTNPKNQLDILSSNYLVQPYYKNQALTVVGLAKGYEEALTVLMQIVDDARKETGSVDLKAYLAARQKQKEGENA
ncbi:hypothetical protein [Hominifimenecus sp. rT4P-3]|uniref:hypothetical protein n=1 Tax=Hominifimenecus sp. rT4P-3 TaxID=3242979 RepID=UPI003DA6ABF5